MYEPHVIYKYPVTITEKPQPLELPRTAKILHVGMQSTQLVLWAEVDPNEPLVRRTVTVIATGQPFPRGLGSDNPGDHVGTVFDGPYVWHIFISPSYQ